MKSSSREKNRAMARDLSELGIATTEEDNARQEEETTRF